MSNNIIQTLPDMRVETEADADEWTDTLATAGLLTELEAEVVVRYYGRHDTRQEIADALEVSPSRIDNLRYQARDDLLAAERTLATIGDLRDEVQPGPY